MIRGETAGGSSENHAVPAALLPEVELFVGFLNRSFHTGVGIILCDTKGHGYIDDIVLVNKIMFPELDEEEIEAVMKVENAVTSLLDLGWTYPEIKAAIEGKKEAEVA